MPKTELATVTAYIAAQPKAVQPALKRVRAILRKAVPAATESISYQIPTYKLDGARVIYFAGWKAHYGLYPVSDGLLNAFKKDLPEGVVRGRTLRFPLDAPVPAKLIERIAKFRAKEALAGALVNTSAKTKATKKKR